MDSQAVPFNQSINRFAETLSDFGHNIAKSQTVLYIITKQGLKLTPVTIFTSNRAILASVGQSHLGITSALKVLKQKLDYFNPYGTTESYQARKTSSYKTIS